MVKKDPVVGGVELSTCPVWGCIFLSSSLCIVNDELFVRDASPQETQSAFSIPVSTLSSSSEPSLSQEQQEMVQAFSAQSGMKLEWSQKWVLGVHGDGGSWDIRGMSNGNSHAIWKNNYLDILLPKKSGPMRKVSYFYTDLCKYFFKWHNAQMTLPSICKIWKNQPQQTTDKPVQQGWKIQHTKIICTSM